LRSNWVKPELPCPLDGISGALDALLPPNSLAGAFSATASRSLAALAIRIWSSKSGERSAATPPKTTLCTAGSTNTFSLGPGCC
jgi:hypothetical protein